MGECWRNLTLPKTALQTASGTRRTRSPAEKANPLRQSEAPTPGPLLPAYFNNIGQEEVCVFLRDLLRHLRGPVIAILDNSQTHHVIYAYLYKKPRELSSIEQFDELADRES